MTLAAIDRIQQGISSLHPARGSNDETLLLEWLTPDQYAAFLELPRYDRAHLLRVGKEMITRAPDRQELVVAAFLHDLGKVSGAVHVRLVDRAVKVLLEAISPRMLRRLATPPPTGIRGGIVLAVHHPVLGAERARELGCSERTCWLIAHHEEAGAMNDSELGLLAAIDDATF